MSANIEWRELYQAALLELRPEELRREIDAAEQAIRRRIVVLRLSESSSAQESQALEDALRGLCVLAITECQTQRIELSDLAKGEVAS
jgi:hypothetical protein